MGDRQPPPSSETNRPAYRVLARKYRPASLDALVGQDVLVRTLRNAFEANRIAHAYMLAGVRGVGKTTTARIIARSLNCVGADGGGGMTVNPCGVCEPCVGIAQDRHLDVIEMDAASRTGVEAMRELLDGVRYRPTSARFKVYIIDEVHMLSTASFNALLKTLEEPPEHVKFIFATTEIRKVPVTVLSRCQRFDLRRIDQATLAEHLAGIARAEAVAVTPAALALLARAADGSVRDALSLLDQAIAHAGGVVDEAALRDMLGLADRTLVFDLFEAVMRGDAVHALALLRQQYDAGADPAAVLMDLLDLGHWLTRVRLTPDLADQPGLAEAERVRGKALALALALPALARAWQMLLKGLGETRLAPVPVQAAEMVLIRLAYTALLPTPAEALADGGAALPPPSPSLSASPSPSLSPSPSASPPPSLSPSPALSASPAAAAAPRPPLPARPLPPSAAALTSTIAVAMPAGRPVAMVAAAERPAAVVAQPPLPTDFEAVIRLAEDAKEALLAADLIGSVRLVGFEVGQIALALEEWAPAELPQRLSRFLGQETGRPWLVTLSSAAGMPPVRVQRQAAAAAVRQRVEADPLVAAILDRFPGAQIESIRRLDELQGGTADGGEAAPPADGEAADGEAGDGENDDAAMAGDGADG